jgi:hypothetical protein
MLRNELKPPNRKRRRGRFSQGVRLLHDNARTHSAAHTKETFKVLKIEALDHPQYSPNIATFDFHLFGPLKKALRGRRFADDDKVTIALPDWLRTKKKLFLGGIRKLVEGSTACIENRKTM